MLIQNWDTCSQLSMHIVICFLRCLRMNKIAVADGEYVFCEDYTPTSQGLGFGHSQPNENDDRYAEECGD